MQHKDLTGYKLFLSAIGGFILDCLGGCDNLLVFLFLLIGIDIVSGICKAVKTKTLSSTLMRDGLVKKIMILLMVALSVRADLVFADFYGHGLMWNGHELYFRSAFCLWFCLEELLSVIENLAILGVRFPQWVRDILLQVDNGINSTTTTQIISIAKKLFGNKQQIKEDGSGVEDSGSDNTLLDDSENADK